MNDAQHTVWLGLGGNLGDVKINMAQALQLLNEHAQIELVTVSSIYKTPPWGVEDQPWFLNCCAEIKTSLLPEMLLEECQAAERAGNRERLVRWGPRTIDIDILVFEGVEQVEQRLTIPHPRMLERAFVLTPLAEIAPGVKIEGKSCADWAAEMSDDTIETEIEGGDWWQR